MHRYKLSVYTFCLAFLSFLLLSGCLSGKRPPVTISPQLDKRVRQISSLPITVGLYIEPGLRNYVQEAPMKQYEAGTPTYAFPNFVFPIGAPLSSKIEEMSKIVFNKVIFVDNLQNKELLNKEAFDGILAVRLKNSDIEIYVEPSVGRAIGRHNLSIISSFLDQKLDKIWESEVTVEGKGLDVITSKIEQEWWMTSGPKFGMAVDESIQKITYELAQKITASKEISDYIHREK